MFRYRISPAQYAEARYPRTLGVKGAFNEPFQNLILNVTISICEPVNLNEEDDQKNPAKAGFLIGIHWRDRFCVAPSEKISNNHDGATFTDLPSVIRKSAKTGGVWIEGSAVRTNVPGRSTWMIASLR